MQMTRLPFAALTLTSALCLAGCGADNATGAADHEASGGQPTGSSGVAQSGAQDFGRFRGIIEDGELPAASTLDPVGFFNEHKIELPEADCGDSVCLHGLLGVQGNMISGNNCTVALIGFNTPLSPDDFERPPLNLSIAVDTSGSMAGAPMDAVRAGLVALVDDLQAKDSVVLVTYSEEAQAVIDSNPETDPDRALLRAAVESLQASGSTNIYAGMRGALEAVQQRAESNRQNRIILLSDGVATAGITDRERIVNLGTTYANEGIGITTIGVGGEFDLELMRKLSETGSGNFYFLEDVSAVEEVFTEELKTFLVPLAQEIDISFDVAPGYEFRAAYGTRLWQGDADGATIEIPSLFMAGRQSSEDVGPGGGRRGGGGAILVELVPTTDEALASQIGPGAPAGTITMSYRVPGTTDVVTQEVTVTNPLAPGQTPAEGEFEAPSVEKAFVALNIYAGFQMAVERANIGAGNAALNVLNPLAENVDAWVTENPDPDIEDDLDTMRKLIDVVEATGARESVGAPPNPWPND